MFLGVGATVINPSSTMVPILTIQDIIQCSGKGTGLGVTSSGF